MVGAEAISRIIDWEDRSTAILFGDGAGAAVVSPLARRGRDGPPAGARPPGILGFDLGGDGSGADSLLDPGRRLAPARFMRDGGRRGSTT